MRCPQAGQCPRNQIAGYPADATQHQTSTDFARRPGELRQPVETGQNLAALFDHGISMRIEFRRTGRAVEKINAEFALQVAHLVGHRGRCDVQAIGRNSEALRVGDSDQGTQLSNIHKMKFTQFKIEIISLLMN